MARMSIDDMFLRDPRVIRIARRLNWSKYETRGRLLDVFALVYDRVDAGGNEFLSADDIDDAADFPGLAEVMLKEDFAVQSRAGLRIRGATERVRYLATRETSGRAGGIKSGETRRKKREGNLQGQSKVTFEKNEAPSNPSASASASASAPDTPTPIATAPDTHPEGAGGSITWDLVLENITDRYKAAYGTPPIWGRQREVLKQLCVDHGLGEVYRRTNIMFESPPDFLRKSPCDIGTLKSNWNKLVRPTERKTSGGDNLDYLERRSQEPA